ncbi:hypothetical protein A447_05318 [Fusobacterium vincentii ATCC 51190]|uniref:Uncharacterized protein n=2 Tax=Fusobacterium TaxID=848 RepID=A0AAJ1CRC2_FUSVC|nr:MULTISPECIES: hypothetical protein [Fusobacterium]ETT14770.1 hypothetical protein HMPREF1497_0327 [Fusobacterium sp. CM21]ALF19449.1 hypothetical protein RN99_02940 [Fusobacterium vincentii ChDC F8]EJG09188.1 hypothetical protein A447_05318 [Fusobacterium vincentii ATCC 51190]ERT45234.1 hypothetical protein HMPREF1768_01478 [Fusobacterium nucleatum CTI-7]MCW0262792.1 hypothetical protein [Fusobacterium vincentii]
MIVIIVSLILIFIGNSLPLNGVLVGITLPFITFIIGKRRSLFFIFLAWLLFSLQTDKYSFNLLVMSLFGFLNFLLFCYVEYDRKSIFYLIPLDIVFYLLIVYKNLFNGIDIKYLIINIISFFILNYFYTSRKNKRKIDEA